MDVCTKRQLPALVVRHLINVYHKIIILEHILRIIGVKKSSAKSRKIKWFAHPKNILWDAHVLEIKFRTIQTIRAARIPDYTSEGLNHADFNNMHCFLWQGKETSFLFYGQSIIKTQVPQISSIQTKFRSKEKPSYIS